MNGAFQLAYVQALIWSGVWQHAEPAERSLAVSGRIVHSHSSLLWVWQVAAPPRSFTSQFSTLSWESILWANPEARLMNESLHKSIQYGSATRMIPSYDVSSWRSITYSSLAVSSLTISVGMFIFETTKSNCQFGEFVARSGNFPELLGNLNCQMQRATNLVTLSGLWDNICVGTKRF